MEKKTSIFTKYFTIIFSVAVLVGFDQFTKYLAVEHLRNQNPLVLIKGVFELLYLENRGAAFGMFQNKQIIFVIGAIIILIAGLYFWQKMPWSPKYLPLRIVCVLICAGAIGNLIDRLSRNYVVDFFYFKLIDFPVFNVADIYVTVACFLFIILLFFFYKEEDLSFKG